MPAGAQIINTAGGKQLYTIVTTGSAIRSTSPLYHWHAVYWVLTLVEHVVYRASQKKLPPCEKCYISEIVADIFTKFAEITDEDSVYISCRFY